MPRDLNAIAKDQSAPDDMPELTKSPDDLSPKEASGRPATATIDAEDEDGMLEGSLFSQISQRNEKRDELHPYCQTLKPSDVESCTRLEEEAFPPHERATREKVSLYHLLLLCFARRRRTRWPPVTATPPLYCLALRALSSLYVLILQSHARVLLPICEHACCKLWYCGLRRVSTLKHNLLRFPNPPCFGQQYRSSCPRNNHNHPNCSFSTLCATSTSPQHSSDCTIS
jgi:hypothetical protein